MRCIFMLASNFGLDCFDAAESIKETEIAGVITPKEKYLLRYGGGYSKEMENHIFHSLAAKCQKKNIPLFVMDKMNSQETIKKIQEWQPELIIVSGWYHMIGKTILDIPQKGVVGLHSSLLPKYRGGAPLVWQIINGERMAGISLFYMDEGTDSGDIIDQKAVTIEEYDTIATLYEKINKEGIRLLKNNLPLIAIGKAPRIKQVGLSDDEIYPQRNPQDGIIDWTSTSRQIYDFVRAQTRPYPGAYTYYLGYKIIIWNCTVISYKFKSGIPGNIVDIKMGMGKYELIVLAGDSEHAVYIKDFLVLNDNGEEVEIDSVFFRVNESFVSSVKCVDENSFGKENSDVSTDTHYNTLF